MKWPWVLILTAFLMFMHPLRAEARTSVYVSIGIGGAAVVGGAFIFWSISHSSRVSIREPATSPFPLETLSLRIFEGVTPYLSTDQFKQDDSEKSQGLTIELPVFRYRW